MDQPPKAPNQLALEQIDYRALFEKVKLNIKALDACKRHTFISSLTDAELTKAIGRKAICAHCHGTMDLIKAYQYVLGYVAAGGNPEDVWPGWINGAVPK